jgi:hypothetical protein
MLRTIELILGIPPMSQYDAAATPLYRCFRKEPMRDSFTSAKANVDLEKRNTVSINPKNALFDLVHVDAVPETDFNEDIWLSLKGRNKQMPVPRRSAFVMTNRLNMGEEDDD